MCAQLCLPVQWCSGGGVFVSPAPAYADGYVAPDGNIYYGYKSDADYSKDRFKIEVHYYSNEDDAVNDRIANQDPLGQYVHVKYVANLNSKDNEFDKWAFRPMWWYGVPAGLTNVHNVIYSRFEKYTGDGNPVPSRPGLHREDENVTKHYANSKDWRGVSRFYVDNPSTLTSKNGLKTLLGIDDSGSRGYDSKGGTTADNWSDFHEASKGMQGMFVDWESAGKRFYEMTYVAKLTDEAWKQRDVKPLRFAAGVYRFAGNWHIATGQIHRAPKIADSLKVQYPKRTAVENTNSLKDGEKTKVKTEITNANADTPHFSDLLDDTAGITVGADGTATLKFKDKTTLTMPGKLLVVEDKKDNVKFPPIYPAPMGVVNPQKLSTDDQNAIIAAFKKENAGKEFLNKVSKTDSDVYKFDNTTQNLTITYTDGSTITVPYSSLVYQGATIADWAPYSVPDMITVDNLTNITDTDVTTIKKAFDDANSGLDVYTNAKTKDSTGYLTIDKNTGNATIKWEDGSTTEIASWQFLKEKEKTAPAPEPSTPVAKKEFKVTPARIVQVNFNPFNTSTTEINTGANKQQIDNLKIALASYAKDSESGSAVSGVTVVYGVDSTGAGTVTFKASGYNDKTYPMSMFFQQRVANQKPAPDTTLHHPGQKTAYQYYVDPVEVDDVNSPSGPNQIAAFKKFMKKNYNVDITDQEAVSAYTLKENDKPVAGVENMQRYVKGKNNGAGVVSFSLNQNGTIAVQGFETNDNNSKKLFDVPLKDLYVAKTQTHTDNTFDQLKAQALALWNQKKTTDGLTDRDFKRVGIDPTKYPAAINNMTDSDENKAALRKLIQQLYEANKVTRKYNTPAAVEVANASTPTDDDFKKAIKAFLDANYTGAGEVSNTTYSMTSALKPKPGTADMEPYDDTKNPVGITTISKGTGNALTVKCNDGTSFTVDVTFKNKQDTPAGNDLDKLKKQAKELIDRNPKLTDEQKKQFKDKIDQADTDTKEKIQNILKEANKQAGENNVKPEDIQKKEKEEKEKRENEQKEKDKKEREKKQKDQLQTDKTNAENTINGLSNLSNEDKSKLKTELTGADTTEKVQKILEKAKAINDARGALKEDALPFLSHGKSDSNDDKALKELIGADPAKKDSTLTDLENALKATNATAESINNALAKAKLQNTSNEQNAKNAGIAKLEAKKAELDAAYNALSGDDKNKAKSKYDDAIKAIDDAKTAVNNATKPSEIKTAVDGVDTKIEAANNDIKTNTPKRDTTGNTNDPDATTFQSEKDKAKKEIDNIPGLTEEEKTEYKKQIDQSTHTGDPETFVNQAKKHKKIKDALDKLNKDFKHLNNAQKDAFKAILKDTDALDHKNADGTTSDDIDDALANAANTDNAMARLGELKAKADEFAKGEKYKGLQEGNEQKKAFDAAATAAGAVLDKAKGDDKNADQVNELYNDLLKAMRAIDPNAQSAGLKTAALKNEIDSDKKFKPSETDPTTNPGNSVYTTASADKKAAFDAALTAAEQALNDAKTADVTTADKEAEAQKKVDDALDKLVKARLALDGVDTTALQNEIGNAPTVEESDAYKFATNKSDYDTALKDAKDLIDKLTGKTPAAQGDNLDTKENKQKALDAALKKLQDAAKALDGKKPAPTPVPTPVNPTPEPVPTPAPSPVVDKSHLQQGINDGNDVHNSDEYNNAHSDKKQAYDHALDHANEVNNDPNATQDQVNQAAEDLKKAEHDLNPTSSPLPSPVPGGHEGDSSLGFGVNDNAPTTVDKSELNIQIDSAEADSQPGNAGNGNAGSNNAGTNNAGNDANSGTNSGTAGNTANNNAAKANSGSNANNSNAANSAAVNAAVESSPAVKQADAQVSKAQAALDAALAEAKKVAADPNATQAQVDAAAQKLADARKSLDAAQDNASKVRAVVREQVLKRVKGSKLSKTGSDVSVFGMFAAGVAAAGAALFVSKRRGISRHCSK